MTLAHHVPFIVGLSIQNQDLKSPCQNTTKYHSVLTALHLMSETFMARGAPVGVDALEKGTVSFESPIGPAHLQLALCCAP